MDIIYVFESWKFMLEIAILWFVYYMFLLFIQGTRTIQVIKGSVIIAALYLLTQVFGLDVLRWIMTKLLAISVLAFLIIFQPELRRALARIGQFGLFVTSKETLDDILKSVFAMSKKKTGSLIAIEREIGLKGYIESGVPIDSRVTPELIATIFTPGAPLHDGGVVIQGEIVAAAGCLFPLTQNPHVAKTLGTRHRAALGLSEETDAAVVVVSEETGAVSVAMNGHITRDLDEEGLQHILANIHRPKRPKRNFFDFWTRLAARRSA